jgi:hypothetical protein
MKMTGRKKSRDPQPKSGQSGRPKRHYQILTGGSGNFAHDQSVQTESEISPAPDQILIVTIWALALTAFWPGVWGLIFLDQISSRKNKSTYFSGPADLFFVMKFNGEK